ncbi:MAG: YhcH/YjgK/YiaL family protein [Bacteroides sp.]|nr:YhcH/YjgK/YiaL family protein [Bacteroides sp.]
MSDDVSKAIQFLQSTDFSDISSGRYNLDELSYYNVDVYMPKKFGDGRFESHRKYIDVQYIVDGEERIYVSDIQDLNILEPYDEDKDVIFYENNGKGREVILRGGEYAVFYPKDGHMSSMASDIPQQVKKVVVKVPVK